MLIKLELEEYEKPTDKWDLGALADVSIIIYKKQSKYLIEMTDINTGKLIKSCFISKKTFNKLPFDGHSSFYTYLIAESILGGYKIIASISDYEIEKYSNYLKQNLYTRYISLKNNKTGQLIKKIRVTFVSYFEQAMIEKKLAKYGISEIENKDTISKINSSDKKPNYSMTEYDILITNLPAFRYYNMSMGDWIELENKTKSILSGLKEFLKDRMDKDILEAKLFNIDFVINNLDEYFAELRKPQEDHEQEIYRALNVEDQRRIAEVANFDELEDEISKMAELKGIKPNILSDKDYQLINDIRLFQTFTKSQQDLLLHNLRR